MDEYGEMVRTFYRIYQPLRERYGLRLHTKFSVYEDGLIEIYRYEGEERKELILKVKEEDDVDCYKRAVEQLLMYRDVKNQK